VAVARRDLRTLVSVGTIADAPLSAAASSALAGRFDADCRATTDRVERVSRRGRSSGSNCERDNNLRTLASLPRSRAVSIDCRASARAERSDRRRRRRGPDRCGDGRSGTRRRLSFQARSSNRAAPQTARQFAGSRADRPGGLSTPRQQTRTVVAVVVHRGRPRSVSTTNGARRRGAGRLEYLAPPSLFRA
jgi:hypothetical protein